MRNFLFKPCATIYQSVQRVGEGGLRARILIELLLVLLIVGINQSITLIGSGEPQTQIELKPLEIKGPKFAEVNETIPFIVTSEGSPVEGATVSFAGYKKETNKNGIATFQINFAGPFKAIAQKEGYTSSTILWVFPRGDEHFSIRGIRLHPEHVNCFLNAYKMAGANFVTFKIYYQPDSDGNIHPLIKEAKGGPLWVEVPDEVHKGSLAWDISHVKNWGFKVYLHVQLPAWHAPPPSSKEAIENYFNQMKREALRLAEFAEEQGVDILDPFGVASEEDFSLYKELLPELRKRFSGELAVMVRPIYYGDGGERDYCAADLVRRGVRVRGFKVPEYNYTGFDYVTLFCQIEIYTNSPSELKNALSEYFESAERVRSEYGVKVFPAWVGRLDARGHEETALAFFEAFDNFEDAKIWWLNTVFEEALRRNFEGIEAYLVFPNRPIMVAEPSPLFDFWQSRRPFNVVAKNFHHPWNEEGKSALRVLQHALLAVKWISVRSSNPDLVRWASTKIEEAFRTFERGGYASASSIAQEILRFLLHVKNPLGISIDGDRGEWIVLDPVYFNPSEIILDHYNLHWYYGEWVPIGGNRTINLSDAKNIKCVYAINDPENLYLMIEFDGMPGIMPHINIDVGSDGFYEFHIPPGRDRAELRVLPGWGVEYEFVGNLEDLAQGQVIELKIPLEMIQKPEKISLQFCYLDVGIKADWGDIEVSVMNWGAPSPISSISILTSSDKLLLEETITVSGFIYPAHTDATVTLTYKMPNGTILTRNVTSTALGEFEDTFTPKIAGSWTVKASWDGDLDHEGAESSEVSFTVERVEAPAKFTVTDLSISPTEVEVKQKITISVKVTNTGEQTGSCTIDLKVAGAIVDTKTVTLAGGESTTVTFELVKGEVGTFDVEVAGLKSAFLVKEIPLSSPPWELYATIAAVIVVAVGVATIIYRRRR